MPEQAGTQPSSPATIPAMVPHEPTAHTTWSTVDRCSTISAAAET
jgi:hypothetical protein